MANQSEEYRIILRVEGEAQVAKLSEEIRKEEKALADLAARLRATGATQDQVMKATGVYAQSIANLNQQLAAAHKQITEAGGSSKNLAQGLVQLGYAADDAQYGMRGLANNIQPLLMSFGVGAGLAGVIGTVITATVVLTDKWDRLMASLGLGKPKTAAEEMQALAEATNRTAEETAKLEDYQRRQAARDSMRGGRPKAEVEQNRAVADAINEAGGDARLIAGITAARNTGVGGLNPLGEGYQEYQDAQKMLANPERFATRTAAGTVGNTAEVKEKARLLMEAARQKNIDATKRQVEDLLGRAGAGDQQAFKALMGEVQKNPGMFPPDALKQLQQGTPQAIHGKKIEGQMDQINAQMERTQGRGQAEADRLKRMTADWVQDEARVGDNLARGEGREIAADRQGQRQRAAEHAEQVKAAGGMDMVKQAMLGTIGNGGTIGQAQAKAFKMFSDQGMSVEEATKAANAQMKDLQQGGRNAIQDNMERLREGMGARQIHQGFAAFHDSVMTSGGDDRNNANQMQMIEVLRQSQKALEQVNQTLQRRTFTAHAS